MVKRTFSELPVDYQTGCHWIESQSRKLLTAVNIKFDDVYWDNLGLVSCYLYVRIADKVYPTKFGKIALTQTTEPSVMRSIVFRLKLMINTIKQSLNYSL